MKRGNQLQEVAFLLRHPEAMLFDLSNPEAPFSFCSSSVIEDAFLDISRALEVSELGKNMRRITGDDLRPEIAVSGDSQLTLDKWKKSFLASSLRQIPIDMIESENSSRGFHRTESILRVDASVQRFVREFAYFYSQFVHPSYWAAHPCLVLRRLYPTHLIWKRIATLPGAKLFVLSAGLSLGVSYMAATMDANVFFTEVHRQNDANQFSRIKTFSAIYPCPNAERHWVIIDKAYSGGTIDTAANVLRATFGPKIRITKVALFPKSLGALKRADFVVYAGRLFKVRNIAAQLTPNNWHLQLLRMGG